MGAGYLKGEKMYASRNDREGFYLGKWDGRHARGEGWPESWHTPGYYRNRKQYKALMRAHIASSKLMKGIR
jgi:hypothetical protein